MKNTIEIYNHQCTRRDLLLLICTCFLSSLAQGEVTLDGSVGPTGALTGPDYKVTENVGKRAGSNLFHSFGRFNLNASESATFSGSTGIKNVISRVTGGQTSNIDGTLRVSIPKANMYLLNPAGVIFGEHAKLDVPGSFHVSTADYLKFQDGVRFDSGVATAPQVLTTATPEAFGFLGENPAGISLSGGANSVLEVQQNSNLSLIGGDITVENTALAAAGGQINLASVGSSGEVIVTGSGLDTTSFNKMGDIRISHDPRLPIPNLGASIVSSKVFVRGGQLVIDKSTIASGPGDDREINIGLTGNLTILGLQNTQDFIPGGGLYNFADNEDNAGKIILKVAELKLVQGAIITTDTLGAGDSDDLIIKANTISLSGNRTRISNRVTNQGEGGDLIINVEDKFEVLNGAVVTSDNSGAKKSGNVTIKANTITLSGEGTKISNEVRSQGDGGNLTINVEDKFEILNGAQISSSTDGIGDSGNLTIKANTLSLSGGGDSRTAISSVVQGQGDSGDLTINVEDKFEILNGAYITSNNNSRTDKSKSGSTLINAGSMLISAKERPEFTGVFANTFGAGIPSDLTINTTKSLKILNGGHIETLTVGAAKGGDAKISSESILLSGKDVRILGAATSKAASDAHAGKLTLKAAKSLEVNNGALIITDTNSGAQGGDLLIEAGNIKISDGQIRSLTRPFGNSPRKNNKGNAGDLKIEVTGKVELSDNALISTSTSGAGQGGDLIVTANDILLDESRLEATSKSRDINVFRDPNVAKAGNIVITPKSTFNLKNGSSINVGTEAANAGDITINKGKILQLSDSKISTSVQDGKGNGGNIAISTPIVALDNSSIIAQAKQGQGGNIKITGFLFQSPSSEVNASSELGIDGNIDLKPDTNISGSLAVLPDTFMNSSQQLSERCVARSENKLSSFVVKGRGGVPLSPGNLVPSNFEDYSLQNNERVPHHSLENNKSSSHSGLGKKYQFASMSIDCSHRILP